MSLAVLERVELIIEDFSIPCEGEDDCDSGAVYVVQTFCCPRLLCAHCVSEFTFFVSAFLDMVFRCHRHPEGKIKITKISDLIKSIDPI